MKFIIVCSDRHGVGKSLLTSILAEGLPHSDIVAVTGSDSLLRYKDSGRVYHVADSDSIDQLLSELLTAVDECKSSTRIIDLPVAIDRSSIFIEALYELGDVLLVYIVSPDEDSRRLLRSIGKQTETLAIINTYMPNAIKTWEKSVEAQQWSKTAIWTSLPVRIQPIIIKTYMPFTKLWSADGGQQIVSRQAIKMWYEDTLSNVIHYIGGEDHGTD